jgi:hypothetical protein
MLFEDVRYALRMLRIVGLGIGPSPTVFLAGRFR